MLFFGMSLLMYFPKPILGGLVVFLGLSILVEWVFDSWFRLPRIEYFVVLLILLVIGIFGLLTGVGVGVLAAVLIFIVNYSRIDVVNQSISGASMRSNVDRPSSQQKILRKRGGQIHILKLRGYLFFGTAHSLFQSLKELLGNGRIPMLRYVVIDFRRVTGLDSSTEISFVKMMRLACERRVCLVCTAVSNRIRLQLDRMRIGAQDIVDIRYFPDLDHGLQWCEDEILASDDATPKASVPSADDRLHQLFPDCIPMEKLTSYMERLCIARGEFLIRQGAPANHLFFIEQGELSVQLEIEGSKPLRLRTMRAGTVFGEIALYLDVPRSVSVVATKNSVYYRLSRQALKSMERKDPDLAIAFQGYLIRLLSDRLVDLNRTLQDLSR
jgi:SulP family sulfate permease